MLKAATFQDFPWISVLFTERFTMVWWQRHIFYDPSHCSNLDPQNTRWIFDNFFPRQNKNERKHQHKTELFHFSYVSHSGRKGTIDWSMYAIILFCSQTSWCYISFALNYRIGAWSKTCTNTEIPVQLTGVHLVYIGFPPIYTWYRTNAWNPLSTSRIFNILHEKAK